MSPLAMFPLGTVLVPSMLLRLQVFEPRYRRMVRDCTSPGGTPELGVVLIERGSEVGGGDVRTDVGTVARMLEVVPRPGGGYLLQVVGTRRVRVRRWLGDDPYPRAEVEHWPDGPPAPEADADALLDAAWDRLQRALILHAELGDGPLPAVVERAEDLTTASHQVTAMAPLGPFDRQRLLRAPDAVSRLATACRLLDDALAVLHARADGR